MASTVSRTEFKLATDWGWRDCGRFRFYGGGLRLITVIKCKGLLTWIFLAVRSHRPLGVTQDTEWIERGLGGERSKGQESTRGARE
jgi:hypothetical protein